MVKQKKDKKVIKKEVQTKTKKTVAKVTKAASSLVKKKKEEAKVKAIKPKIEVKVKPAVVLKQKPKPEIKHVVTKTDIKPVIKPKSEPAAEVSTHIKVEPKVEIKIEPKIEIKPVIAPEAALKELIIELPITVKDLAIRLQEKPSTIIKSLMDMRIMVGINNSLDEATANKICEKYHFKVKTAPTEEETTLSIHNIKDESKNLKIRPPIVTFMGHVDHGKTSLLDAIRKTKVAEGEHGGITQHIGAYRVVLPGGEITFLDTPGHEAFTAMRSRGASVTDIVVLVVAADDGIMPQTQEAIDHAKAAGVSIIVAMNKIDKAGADIDRVKKQLAKVDLNPEDWGGKTICVPVSAKTAEGIDNLLEMILLEAQMLELKANPNRLAKGIVIEAQMSKGRGPVSTLLIQNGSLRLNENIIVGNFYGKIRAMFDDHGHSVTVAPPAFPVEVLGISGVPDAGEQFFAIADEKQAKELATLRAERQKQQDVKVFKKVSLEELHAQIQAGKIKELNIIIKADVQGSLEAIKETLNKLNVSEIKLNIIHAGVGNINNSDVILAVASNALILGFNVAMDDLAKELVGKEGVDVKTYNIIYELANDIKAAIEGMLEPKIKKVFLGRAEVRKVFKLSRAGIIAGCFVVKGKFNRTSMVSLVRNGEVVFEGKLSSLKRFKDDVRDVAEGFECGMSIAGFDQLMEGDIIEAYEEQRILRKL